MIYVNHQTVKQNKTTGWDIGPFKELTPGDSSNVYVRIEYYYHKSIVVVVVFWDMIEIKITYVDKKVIYSDSVSVSFVCLRRNTLTSFLHFFQKSFNPFSVLFTPFYTGSSCFCSSFIVWVSFLFVLDCHISYCSQLIYFVINYKVGGLRSMFSVQR